MRLIDADAADVNEINCSYSANTRLEDVEEWLNDQPTVDPVKHGRWVKPVSGDGEDYCSVCKAEPPWFHPYGYYEPCYCPNCGAKMDADKISS